VIAAGPPAEWTAGQTAAHAGVSHHEADKVLRRFAAAGIVERVDIPGRPHRYSWTPTLAYLTTTAAVSFDTVIDPICGMPVPAATPHLATDGPEDVRFCSLNCLVRWRAANRSRRGTVDQVHTRLATDSAAGWDGATAPRSTMNPASQELSVRTSP